MASKKVSVRLDVDLPTSDAEALFRHLQSFQPDSGDYREDARIRDAIEVIRDALEEALKANF